MLSLKRNGALQLLPHLGRVRRALTVAQTTVSGIVAIKSPLLAGFCFSCSPPESLVWSPHSLSHPLAPSLSLSFSTLLHSPGLSTLSLSLFFWHVSCYSLSLSLSFLFCLSLPDLFFLLFLEIFFFTFPRSIVSFADIASLPFHALCHSVASFSRCH